MLQMKTKPIFLLLLLSSVILMSGCATYRHRVRDDFRDAVKLNVGVGLGFYVRAKATSFFDAGMGWGGYWREVGLEDRYTDFVRESLNGCAFPLELVPGAVPGESPEAGLRLANVRGTSRGDDDYMVVGQIFDAPAIAKWDAYGYQKKSLHQVFTNSDKQYTEQPFGVEAGVGLLVITIHVGFDPVELVDFLGALCGLDLLRDHGSAVPEGGANGREPLTPDNSTSRPEKAPE
jgi:hypothetical protein